MQCLFFYISDKAEHQQTNAAAKQKENHSSTDEDHTGSKTPTGEDSKKLNIQLFSKIHVCYTLVTYIIRSLSTIHNFLFP